MPDLVSLCSDLEEEHRALDAVVAPIDEASWDIPTPAVPWTVRDQISHLAFFDRAAAMAVADPAAFQESLGRAAADIEDYMEEPLRRGRALSSPEVLDDWRAARHDMLKVFRTVDPSARIPWYGPPMGAASFISARLMETWAHGQDVVDGLGVRREATDRLRHVAHLGVRARRFSYIANNRPEPAGDVRVELVAPSGEVWTWGESETERVIGSALGFCLVVTQRRHIADTDVRTEGELAREWMSIAQCFAGPPGEGRSPGQFARADG